MTNPVAPSERIPWQPMRFVDGFGFPSACAHYQDRHRALIAAQTTAAIAKMMDTVRRAGDRYG